VEREEAKTSRMRILAEALFSLNAAFAATSLIFTASLSAALPFLRLEVSLNHLLGIRQTDYIRGYFTVWIPSLAIAACILILLQASRNLNVARIFLRSVAGVTIFLSPCVVWTGLYEQQSRWSLDWPYRPIWGEAVLVVGCLWAFLNVRWVIGKWIGLFTFLAHTLFWYFFLSDRLNGLNWGIPHYAGPAGLTLGIFAGLVWELYVRELRMSDLKAVAPVS
jgi:hypothetical protein